MIQTLYHYYNFWSMFTISYTHGPSKENLWARFFYRLDRCPYCRPTKVMTASDTELWKMNIDFLNNTTVLKNAYKLNDIICYYPKIQYGT